MPGDKLGPPVVICNGLAMLATIEFHDQLWIVAGKVRDVSGDWYLPAEVPPFGLEKPELLPQHAFRSRRVVAKGSREMVWHHPTPTPSPSPQGGGEFHKASPSPLWGGAGVGVAPNHQPFLNTRAPSA
jgi:hypothetical protein